MPAKKKTARKPRGGNLTISTKPPATPPYGKLALELLGTVAHYQTRMCDHLHSLAQAMDPISAFTCLEMLATEAEMVAAEARDEQQQATSAIIILADSALKAKAKPKPRKEERQP